MKRYTIEFESSHKQWMVIDTKDLDAQLGYHYDKADARVVADMLNQRTDLLAALERLNTETKMKMPGLYSDAPPRYAFNEDDAKAIRAVIAKAKGGE